MREQIALKHRKITSFADCDFEFNGHDGELVEGDVGDVVVGNELVVA